MSNGEMVPYMYFVPCTYLWLYSRYMEMRSMIMLIPRMTEVDPRDWLVEVISGHIGHLRRVWLSLALMVNLAHVGIESWKNRHVYCTFCILSDTMMVD
jgi:hypothetical protein